MILFFFPTYSVFVHADDSSASAQIQIMKVDHVANLRDRILERITIFFKFSNSDKADYEKYLAEKRFSELKYAFDNGLGDYIEESSSRYSSYLGRLTELVVKNKMVDKKEEILKMFSIQMPLLEELLASQEYESGFWLLLQHNINYLRLYRDQINSIN